MSARAQFSDLRDAVRSARRRDAWVWLIAAGLAAAAAVVSVAAARGPPGWLGAVLAALVAVIAVVDRRRFVIPDELNALGLALGVAAAWFESPIDPAAAIIATLTRAILAATIFQAFRLGYRRWRGRDGMGFGDVKLAGVAGAWLDWDMLPLAIAMAALAALTFVLVDGLVRRRSIDAAAKLPFGAFFAPAIWVAWLAVRWSV